MKTKKPIVLTMTFLIAALVMPTHPVYADADYSDTRQTIQLDTTFTDPHLRDYMEQFDLDADGSFSNEEVEQITNLDLSGILGLQSINGIETLWNLKRLDCSGLGLQTIDLSAFQNLEQLFIQENAITNIDFTQNTRLQVLNCSDNPLAAIQLAQCTLLEHLICDNTDISVLDLSKQTALKELSVDGNDLQSLDLSKLTNLVNLSCNNTNLGFLQLPDNGSVRQLFINKKQNGHFLADQNTFDIHSLFPGIDASRIDQMENATIQGTTISNYTISSPITYRYYCGEVNGEPFYLYYTIQLTFTNDWTEELTISDIVYGNRPQPTASARYGDVIYTYSNSFDGPFTNQIPAEAGTYYCKANVYQTNQYEGLSSHAKEFKILPAANKWIKEPVVNNTEYGSVLTYDATAQYGAARFLFAEQPEGPYEETIPTEAGTYYAKAIVDAHTNYSKLESAPIEFRISAAANYWTKELSIQNWTYGETPSMPTAESRYGKVSFAYSQEKDGLYSVLPSNPDAGTWYVKAVATGGISYSGLASDPIPFEIYKAGSTIAIQNETLDKVYDEQPVTTIQYEKEGSSASVKILYKKWNGSSWTVQKETPVLPGTYRVSVMLEEDKNYLGATDQLEFTISKLQNQWIKEPALQDTVYGEEIAIEAKALDGELEISYSDRLDGTYTKGLPVQAGNWYVKFQVADSTLYQGISKILPLQIKKATPSFVTPSSLSAHYGDTLDSVLLPAGFHWQNGGKTLTQTGTVSYMASYIPEDTKNYEIISDIPVSIKVSKAANSIVSLSLPNFQWGEDLSKIKLETRFGTAQLLFSNDPNGIFSAAKPNACGTWYVKAVVEGTENYDAFTSLPYSFKIQPRKLNIQNVTMHSDSFDDMTILFQEEMLTAGRDYDLKKEWIENELIYTIVFKGNYEGTLSYRILQENTVQTENTGDLNTPLPQMIVNEEKPSNNAAQIDEHNITSQEETQKAENEQPTAASPKSSGNWLWVTASGIIIFFGGAIYLIIKKVR